MLFGQWLMGGKIGKTVFGMSVGVIYFGIWSSTLLLQMLCF
jgi:hypothetical protein